VSRPWKFAGLVTRARIQGIDNNDIGLNLRLFLRGRIIELLGKQFLAVRTSLRDHDRDFIKRVDSFWGILFAILISIGGLSVTPLITVYNIQMLMGLILLASTVAVPFFIEGIARLKDSIYLRFVSFVMLPAAMFTTIDQLLWIRFWTVNYTREELEVMMFGISGLDGALLLFPTLIIAYTLYFFFQRNLKRTSIFPRTKVGRVCLIVILFYSAVVNLTLFFIGGPHQFKNMPP
jgi:hypothetical protein